jgi:hypothetical protein
MKTARESLVDVLEEAKRFVARSENDFAWSGWNDREEALAQIEMHIAHAKTGDHSKQLDLEVLFAPTGPLQELSLSSGWTDDFLKLAARFDVAKNA